MSFVYWATNADGDWSTAADWSGGLVPGSADVVTISSTSLHTVTHSQGNDFIAQLSVGDDIFDMTGGSLTISGLVSMANGLAVSGGVLTFGTTAAITNGFTQTGGSVVAAGALKISGTAELLGGYLGGSATMQATSTVTLANYTIGGSVQLVNAHTLDQTGNITLGDNTGINVLISNAAGATYNLANAVTLESGAATAQLTNAGTLAALRGTGTSVVDVSATSTGTISVAAGSTLVFQGALTSLAGSIVGAGTLGFGGGTSTIASGVTISVAAITVYGNNTDVALGSNTTLSGGYSQQNGSSLALGSYTLTITGAAQFEQNSGLPLITGTGTLVTDGPTALLGSYTPALIIGGSAAWENGGTVAASAGFQIGSSNTVAASVTNEAAGVFNLTGDVSISNGSTPLSGFTNAGTLEMTANSGTSNVYVDVVDTGTVSAAAGDTLEFDGPSNSFAGTISGAGQVALGDGTSTIAAATVISVGTFAIYNSYGTSTDVTIDGGGTMSGGLSIYDNGTSVTLAGNETVSGSFSQEDATTFNLSGHTLTLTGAASFYTSANFAPVVEGSGVLVTDGATGLSLNDPGAINLLIGGSAAWRNYGAVTTDGFVQIGNSNTLAASVTNEAGGIFNLAAAIAISNGSTPVSSFANAGTLEMTANSGISRVYVNVVDTGTVLVAAGDTVEFDGPSNSFAGKISGAGQFAIGGGTSTIAGGTAIGIGIFAVYGNGTSVTLHGNATVSMGFTQSDGSTLNLSGHILTLAGAAAFSQNDGIPTVGGSGTLVTKGATTLSGGTPALVIGGTVAWDNYAVVTASRGLQIGSSNTAAASVTNEAGGIFNLVAATAIANGSTPVSSLTNVGTLEMTANSGMSSVNVNVVDMGTVSAAAGDTLEFDGPSNSFAGTISGAGQVALGDGTSTIAAATVISVGTFAIYNPFGTSTNVTIDGGGTVSGGLSIYDNGTSVSLGGNETVSGSFSQGGTSIFNLAGHTLTLTGAASFYPPSDVYTPTVGGSGVLATDGATTLLSSGAINLIVGGTVAWDNYGAVAADGSLTIGNSNTLAASVTNEAGGVFDLVAPIAISNGSAPESSFANIGIFEQTITTGTSSVATTFANSGTVAASSGVLDFTAGFANTGTVLAGGGGNVTFGGSVGAASGSGVINVETGGSASFTGPVQASQTLDFLDATGSATIDLTSPTSFAATIAGFAKGDTIDLKNIAGATAKFAGGVLTFTNAAKQVVAKLTFSGSHAFTFTTDNNGGTIIGDPPISAATVGLAKSAYFTNVGAATETIVVTGAGELAIGNFSYAHADVLDLRTLLAGTAAAQDLSQIGDYLTAKDAGGNTTLLFDPTGRGGGAAVAVLTGVNTNVGQLVAHHSVIVRL